MHTPTLVPQLSTLSGVPTDAEIATFVRPLVRHARLADRLKATYRSHVCPLQRILGEIPPGAAVLDIGCGRGTLLALVAACRAPRRLAGV